MKSKNNPDKSETFAKIFSALLDRGMVNQTMLAKRLGVERQTISGWKRGTNMPAQLTRTLRGKEPLQQGFAIETTTGEKFYPAAISFRDGFVYAAVGDEMIKIPIGMVASLYACGTVQSQTQQMQTMPLQEPGYMGSVYQQPQSSERDVTVYVTRTGKKYHRTGCRSLAKSSSPMPLSQARSSYSPCGVCGPPQ